MLRIHEKDLPWSQAVILIGRWKDRVTNVVVGVQEDGNYQVAIID